MANLDLRPLSLGEILDRTFSLYREHFLLFVGITAVPQLLVLAMKLAEVLLPSLLVGRVSPGVSGGLIAVGVAGALIGVVVYFVAYLFAQGGTVYAVSELYLGRPTTIRASLERMRGNLGNLFGVTLLNGLAVGAATILLILPGIYVACRLIACVPAALLENLGPSESLSRSFELTRDNAWRSFVIYVLYFFLLYALMLLFVFPFTFAGAFFSARDPEMMQMWMALSQVGSFFASVFVTPFLTIATAAFYYDLRVQKEAFDLQVMMNPSGAALPGNAGVPKMFA